MVHQLCAAAHEAVPSYDRDVLHRCYTDDAWALAIAKQRLDRNFAVVGILERMDETLSLLDRASEMRRAQLMQLRGSWLQLTPNIDM